MTADTESVDTLIIGGGQAGLAVGYHLARRCRSFVILDANERIGDAWRHRWDSLRLFTQARYSGLPGWGFPAPAWSYPTKDQVAEYLEAYAERFALPVRNGVRVESLSTSGGRYVAVSGQDRIEADQVVIATGAYSDPHVPAFATELDQGILQLHSSGYRHPSQLRDGGVLVVGAGNSGAEIASDVAATHRTWLSGRDTGHLPWRLETVWDRLAAPLIWFVGSRVLSVRTPIGRAARAKMEGVGAPLERVQPVDLVARGVERVPRTVAARAGGPALEDGRLLDVTNVIWCTGFSRDYRWVDLPGFGTGEEPAHHRGVVISAPGVYVVGRFFLGSATSALLGGVGKDARHIAHRIASRE